MNDVGGVGGRFDSEYVFFALVIVAIAAVRSTGGGRVAVAGTDASAGFASVLPSAILYMRKNDRSVP